MLADISIQQIFAANLIGHLSPLSCEFDQSLHFPRTKRHVLQIHFLIYEHEESAYATMLNSSPLPVNISVFIYKFCKKAKESFWPQ